MKFCDSHWDKLRAAIADRGLAALVPDNGDQAAANVISRWADGLSIDNFDPLMQAHNAIAGNALRTAGTSILAPNEDGSDRCPLCYLNAKLLEHKAKEPCGNAGCLTATLPIDHFDGWIGLAADGARETWIRLGADA